MLLIYLRFYYKMLKDSFMGFRTMKKSYKSTMCACFTGYIVQAIINNFAPLLFVTFQKTFDIPLSQITALITVNFVIQLLIDLLSAGLSIK